jgi:hypothetical protein
MRTRRGAIVLLFNTKEAAEWLQQPEVELSFTANFASGSAIKPRQFALLVPLTFNTENPGHLREVKERNELGKFTVAKARWIKPTYRQKLKQRVAHATFLMNNATVANNCIRNGIFICSTRVFLVKMKQEPT